MVDGIDVVITGIGIVGPIGIGRSAAAEALRRGRSGIGPIRRLDPRGLPVRVAGEVIGFEPKDYVKPRKNLKVMARDAQLGVAASILARRDAGLDAEDVDPQRLGVILAADAIVNDMATTEPSFRSCTRGGRFRFERWGTEGMSACFPLNFLKVLPNMIASHVSIAHDARGPNNTIHQGDVSGLLAVIEAARVIQRGAADVVIAGGASSQMQPYDWVRHCLIGRLSPGGDDPAAVSRPFDADRDGQVRGEGAAVYVLERRDHAQRRGAVVRGRLLGWSATYQRQNGQPAAEASLARAMAASLEQAGLGPDELGHLNAHGLSTVADDRIEARAIRRVLGRVPVTAPKSFFGNLGAAGGAAEMFVSLQAFADGMIPPTLNYRRADPLCRLRVVREPLLAGGPATAMTVNFNEAGQAVAVVLAAA